MVTNGEDARHHPFGGFRVTTELMADGRRHIHYYHWPEADEGEDRDPEREEPVAAEDGADE